MLWSLQRQRAVALVVACTVSILCFDSDAVRASTDTPGAPAPNAPNAPNGPNGPNGVTAPLGTTRALLVAVGGGEVRSGSDVEALAAGLRVGGAEVELLADPGPERLRAAITRLARSVGPAQAVLLFLSAPGFRAGGRDWIVAAPPAGHDAEALARLAVSVDEVRGVLRASPARLLALLLDVGREESAAVPAGAAAPAAGVAEPAAGGGYRPELTIFSASVGESPAEVSELAAYGYSSPFAFRLAPAVRRPGLTAGEIVKAARSGSATTGEMHAWLESNLEDGAIVLPAMSAAAAPVVARPETAGAGIVAPTAPPSPPAAVAVTSAPSAEPATLAVPAVAAPLAEISWLRIPAGSFAMGCTSGDAGCDGDESPVHEVTLTRTFELAATETTVGQFRRFVAATAHRTDAEREGSGRVTSGGRSEERAGASWKSPGFPQDDSHPVVMVSWNDAEAFCRWTGGRLPTEAEWEYAARGGTRGGKYPWGDDEPKCRPGARNGARFDDNRACAVRKGSRTAAVESYGANGFGLSDMAGNVWEWVEDRYAGSYGGDASVIDPPGPDTGAHRVVRGGSWRDVPRFLRVSIRSGSPPGDRLDNRGFRCARTAGP